jgi:hypothetical protein
MSIACETAFKEWQKQENIHGGFTSAKDFNAGFQAGTAYHNFELSALQAKLDEIVKFQSSADKLATAQTAAIDMIGT